MLEKIKKLSRLLNESYSEKSVVASVGEFFDENFGAKEFNVILKEDYAGEKPHFPLYKHNKIIGYIEFSNTSPELEKFLDTAIYLISLKIQNIVLSEKMQKSIDFQNARNEKYCKNH